MNQNTWQFFIDRGGTFTDCLGVSPDGVMHTTKVLSSDEAPLRAIRQLLQLADTSAIPPCEVRMGTTLATNALLERRGARTLLVITQGFRDLPAIGTQARPDIFALNINKPEMLYEAVLETPARASRTGHPLPMDRDPGQIDEHLRAALGRGIESVALVVLNGHLCPELEQGLEQQARAAGFAHVSTSHRIANEIGLLKRADTTVLDAYLTPRLTEYFNRLTTSLQGSNLLVMQSSGDLAPSHELRGPQSLLSGPAGGVVACEYLTRELGLTSAVGFDMGGTSTDVCRVEAGQYPRTYETTIAGVRVVAPMMDVHTVAAGGGSVCTYDAGRFQVGPQSAGASPGPACYGAAQATHLTLTDANLLLGRIVEDHFPFPLNPVCAEACLRVLEAEVNESRTDQPPMARQTILAGMLSIANYNMAEAIREVSLRRGFDVRNDALIVFGGAGGQHACALARELGIQTLVFPKYGGILSACGMACARRARHNQVDGHGTCLTQTSIRPLSVRFDSLVDQTRQLGAKSDGKAVCRIDLRYAGSAARLTLTWCADSSKLAQEFHALHHQRFGYARPEQPIEVVTLRCELLDETIIRSPFVAEKSSPAPHRAAPEPKRWVRMFMMDGAWHERVPLYEREQLRSDDELTGPACVIDQTGCVIIEPGFELRVQQGHLICRDTDPVSQTAAAPRCDGARDDVADPVTLEMMAQAFMGVARQMGSVLQRTATSTNIRERLDFSCALFDRDANLIANAPHIPVHLGAMGETVRHVAAAHPHAVPGDVYVSNDPQFGGSHLPDITVVTPVFDDNKQLSYWVANRGHHADVGGISPGSMPALSTHLDEEGIVLSALPLVQGGRLAREELMLALSSGPFPARDPEQNLADLQAQIAANHHGVRQLRQLEERFSAATVGHYMAHLQDYAEQLTQTLIRGLPTAPRTFRDRLDDGTEIGVELTPLGDQLRVRFEPTPESPGNNNAPRAVTVAAVLYVLRCMLGTRLPLNAGCLRPLLLDIPKPSLLDPTPGRAVSSGNVETSQRLVDVLLGCFGAAAASQGTMNNVTFGSQTFGYYETIAGGAGAGPNFDGASAVHTHMTNTRITDPEVLEARYPVVVRCFEIRRGSGGAGAHRGGDGCVREYAFQQTLDVTLVTERRTLPPFGLAGGQPGQLGRNKLNGQVLAGRCQVHVAAGDVLRIETPGGGGYGIPRDVED